MILFSTKKYEYFKEDMLTSGMFEDGVLEEKTFADGEKYTRIETNFKNKDVCVVGGTISDEDIMDIYDLSCSLVKLGARTLNIVIPYFGYSTMERSEIDGEIVKAKTRARLLSLIPIAYQGNNIIMVDLHKDSITHYFENNVHSINIETNPIIIEKIKTLNLGNYAIGATDEGGAKRIRKISNKLDVPALMLLKRRVGNSVSLECSCTVDASLEHVVIVDDMIRSGGTILQAVEAYSKQNPNVKFTVIATHGVFCDDGYNKLKSDKRIQNIIVSNSHTGVIGKEVVVLNIVEEIIKTLKELS